MALGQGQEMTLTFNTHIPSLNYNSISYLHLPNFRSQAAIVFEQGYLTQSQWSDQPESIKKVGLKTTKKRWKHNFPHYKSIGVFLDTQVQITPYYVVLSGRNSNSS